MSDQAQLASRVAALESQLAQLAAQLPTLGADAIAVPNVYYIDEEGKVQKGAGIGRPERFVIEERAQSPETRELHLWGSILRGFTKHTLVTVGATVSAIGGAGQSDSFTFDLEVSWMGQSWGTQTLALGEGNGSATLLIPPEGPPDEGEGELSTALKVTCGTPTIFRAVLFAVQTELD